MEALAIGIVLFGCLHLIRSLAPSLRQHWQSRLGKNGYRGIFSLLVLTSFALIVFGWRSAVPQYLYTPIPALQGVALGLLVIAFLLMVASARPSRLKRLLRHPQLTGLGLWGVAHLLLNGDSRALVLFGGMALWSMLQMYAINRREGAWIKPPVAPLGSDLVNLVITAIVVALVVYLHPWLAGVPVWSPRP